MSRSRLPWRSEKMRSGRVSLWRTYAYAAILYTRIAVSSSLPGPVSASGGVDLRPVHALRRPPGARRRRIDTPRPPPYHPLPPAGVAEWQTQRTQNPPRATSWGFDPPLRHHLASVTSPRPSLASSPSRCLSGAAEADSRPASASRESLPTSSGLRSGKLRGPLLRLLPLEVEQHAQRLVHRLRAREDLGDVGVKEH